MWWRRNGDHGGRARFLLVDSLLFGVKNVLRVRLLLDCAGLTMDELLEKTRKLREEAASLGAQIKRAKTRARAAAAAAARAWVLTSTVRNCVLAMHVMADGVVDPSFVFLRQKGRQCGWPERTEEVLAALVDDTFFGCRPH